MFAKNFYLGQRFWVAKKDNMCEAEEVYVTEIRTEFSSFLHNNQYPDDFNEIEIVTGFGMEKREFFLKFDNKSLHDVLTEAGLFASEKDYLCFIRNALDKRIAEL